MPDSTKDRPGDMAAALANGYGTVSYSAGPASGTHHSLDGASTPSLKRLSYNNHFQHHSRTDLSPLSIALPLSSRSNNNGNGASAVPAGPLSAGYLEQRRDTFHSLSHPSSSSFQHTGLSFHPTGNIHDEYQSTFSSYQRPQSLSYATLQHPHRQGQQQSMPPASPLNQDGVMRRRRLSTASTSSKQRLGSSANLRSKAHNTPHHTRRFTTLISDQEPDTTYLWGFLLFFSTMIGFTVSMYALVASNYMPMTGNKTLDWIKQDSHYCMLVPVTIPVTVLAVLFNWLGMKLFRHN